MSYCTHYDCRCVTADELALMAERTGRNDLLMKALEVHEHGHVRCRREAKPRPALPKGPSNTHIPLPPRKEDQL